MKHAIPAKTATAAYETRVQAESATHLVPPAPRPLKPSIPRLPAKTATGTIDNLLVYAIMSQRASGKHVRRACERVLR